MKKLSYLLNKDKKTTALFTALPTDQAVNLSARIAVK